MPAVWLAGSLFFLLRWTETVYRATGMLMRGAQLGMIGQAVTVSTHYVIKNRYQRPVSPAQRQQPSQPIQPHEQERIPLTDGDMWIPLGINPEFSSGSLLRGSQRYSQPPRG